MDRRHFLLGCTATLLTAKAHCHSPRGPLSPKPLFPSGPARHPAVAGQKGRLRHRLQAQSVISPYPP